MTTITQPRSPEATPPAYQDFVTLQARLDTVPAELPHGTNARRIAELGFFFTGEGTHMRCFLCGKEAYLCCPALEDFVFAHANFDCRHLHDTVDPIILQTFRAYREINTGYEVSASQNRAYEVDCRSDNSTPENRLRSFKKWTTTTQSPERLAEAGFVYTGHGDRTVCFSCKGGLWKWEAGDDPWVEHARWYPDCEHVRNMKGEEFIRRNRQETSPKTLEDAEIPENNPDDPDPRDPDDAPTNPSGAHGNPKPTGSKSSPFPLNHRLIGERGDNKTLDNGTRPPMAIDELKRSGSAMTWNAVRQLLLDKVKRGEILPVDPATDGPLLEEQDDINLDNERLRKLLGCRICIDRHIDTVFLPCGHLVTCDECASALLSCPVCEEHIKEKVRAYMS